VFVNPLLSSSRWWPDLHSESNLSPGYKLGGERTEVNGKLVAVLLAIMIAGYTMEFLRFAPVIFNPQFWLNFDYMILDRIFVTVMVIGYIGCWLLLGYLILAKLTRYRLRLVKEAKKSE